MKKKKPFSIWYLYFGLFMTLIACPYAMQESISGKGSGFLKYIVPIMLITWLFDVVRKTLIHFSFLKDHNISYWLTFLGFIASLFITFFNLNIPTI